MRNSFIETEKIHEQIYNLNRQYIHIATRMDNQHLQIIQLNTQLNNMQKLSERILSKIAELDLPLHHGEEVETHE